MPSTENSKQNVIYGVINNRAHQFPSDLRWQSFILSRNHYSLRSINLPSHSMILAVGQKTGLRLTKRWEKRSPAACNELLTTYVLTLLKSFTASSSRSASDSLILGAERMRGGFFGPPLPTLDSFHDKIVPTASPPLVLPRPVSLADGDGGLGNQFKDEEQALA